MPELPNFTTDGVLPPGDYALSLEQLAESILVLGPGPPRDHLVWDATWRLVLVANLRVMIEQLRKVGVDEIFIDGSFVEDKDHPNDIDGYFACDPMHFAIGRLEQELNLIDPAKCWTWDHKSRRAYRGYPKLQLPMWHACRVELYPHFSGRLAGTDGHGNALEFPAWFRQRRADGRAKGIIQITKQRAEARSKP